ncbi:MAG: chloride channel protein [Candidatus Brocadiae bacterium]|nr:chloride channel protein [Candidatus Brocadiia bacterium]
MGRTADYLRRLIRKVIPPRAETSAAGMTVFLAGILGVGAGALALLMDWLVRFLNRHLFFEIGGRADSLPSPWHFLLVLVPAVVFLLVAAVLRRWAPEVAGTGISEVMSAIGRRGGFIRKRVVALKVLATSLCIGAGAPLGLEGPVVQAGAALGSLAGRRFRMGVTNIRILVAAGAAAALAAKYGAPIGGAVFSAELLLGSASTAALLPLIVASFLAVVTRNAVLRGAVEYAFPAQPHLVPADYILFALLGVGCGLAAVYFIKMIFATEDTMKRLFSQWWARAVFGGLLIGMVGFVRPELLGTGRRMVQKLLDSPVASLQLLLLFVLLKPLLCSVGLGTGASGGVFAPSLFTGAALGALFARLAAGALPLEIAPSASYVMAGMAGVMAAVMRAPLQAILITFELTHNYSVIPPLMITCVVSMKVSELLEPESAFTRGLVRAGEKIRRGIDLALINGLTVADVMERDYVALPAGATIWEIAEPVESSENRTFPVVGNDGELRGIVMLASLIAAGVRSQESGRAPKVKDLLEPVPVHLQPDDPLYDA